MSPAESIEVGNGWEAARCEPDSCPDPGAAAALDWMPARVPGTAAAALAARDGAGPDQGDEDLDAEDWWFRTVLRAPPPRPGEELVLRIGGIATVSETYLGGRLVAECESMFLAQEIDVGDQLDEEGVELAIRCRALGPLLGSRRKPRARWRTRLVDGRLRFFRTMLLGRAPGFAPAPAAVGPWRPVTLERRGGILADGVRLRTRLDGEVGVLAASGALSCLGVECPGRVELELEGPSGRHRAELTVASDPAGATLSGELRVAEVARWWPHTHGDPTLHAVRLHVDCGEGPVVCDLGKVGFRELSGSRAGGQDPAVEGLALAVNGVPVFARGAVWTSPDPVGLAPGEEELRTQLEQVRRAGMNIVRVVGTGAYESPRFHELCDELGILVWQDFMFANLDYPVADEAFGALVRAELEAVLARVGGRPSLAVLCGNSEVEQQAAMMGLDPDLGRGELFGELLPGLIEEAEVDAVYLPSAPCGGDLPFRADRGVANYFGVGGYRRPLEDARLADVRFASECLAFANVPEDEALKRIAAPEAGAAVVHHPRWKAGVPRDVGAGWDFDDVRDHYLALLFGVDPVELRRFDPERYLELSRAVGGEAMAAVFGEWRRAASLCAGGIVLWLRDLAPGAGWGLLDDAGVPKEAFHRLRRVLAPRAVWLTDEGLNGVGVHIANDRSEPLEGTLRVRLYRDLERLVGETEQTIAVPGHGQLSRDLEGLLGHFADASWAYRFGPPAQDLIVASVEDESTGTTPISEAMHFPVGLPAVSEPVDRLGIEARAELVAAGTVALTLLARRLLVGVRLDAPGLEAEDRCFAVPPASERVFMLRATSRGEIGNAVRVRALNAAGSVTVPIVPQS
ncbi:MAG: hypothetical protein R2725_16395 [Solirubrobacterales bacterium]